VCNNVNGGHGFGSERVEERGPARTPHSVTSWPCPDFAMDLLLDVLLAGTAWTHVLLAPYTKVEESFNLHAAHDVLMYGVSPQALANVSIGLFCFNAIAHNTHSMTTTSFRALCPAPLLAQYF
jgi:hypothetical protein